MQHHREPVGHTCPEIDAIIRQVRNAVKLAKYKSSDTTEELCQRLDDIEWEIRDIESDLENIRQANSDLREWGIEEARRVDDLELEIKELEQEVS